MITIKQYLCKGHWFLMQPDGNTLCNRGFKELWLAQKWMNDNYPYKKYKIQLA